MTASEWLRSLARRGSDHPAAVDVLEALAFYADDPATLVVACRRLLAHRPCDAPLWWACAKVLTALDPYEAAENACRELSDDTTARRLRTALRAHDGRQIAVLGRYEPIEESISMSDRVDRAGVVTAGIELVLVGCMAYSTTRVLVESDHADAVLSRPPGVRAWAVASAGRSLADPLFDAMATRCAAKPWKSLAVDSFDAILGPHGDRLGSDGRALVDCPVAPELLR